MHRFLQSIDQWIVGGERDQYEQCLERVLAGFDSILDVGCGADSPLGRFARRPPRTVGVDGFQPSVDKSRAAGIHDEYVLANALEVGERFQPHSFDAVLASDLIEHLEKEDGRRLIAMLERLARRRVVLFTPNGFLPQGEYDGNPYQLHRSGWEIAEMRALGYQVTGINGWKPLRGEFAAIRWRPYRVWERVSRWSQRLTTDDPTHAFQILCVKDMAER